MLRKRNTTTVYFYTEHTSLFTDGWPDNQHFRAKQIENQSQKNKQACVKGNWYKLVSYSAYIESKKNMVLYVVGLGLGNEKVRRVI